MKKQNIGFTLAEVLITLMIVGVVASLTIPAVLNNTNKVEYVTQLKKSYSAFSQAFIQLKAENGGSIVPVFADDTTLSGGNGNALNDFLTKMSYTKNCGNLIGCLHLKSIYNMDGTKKGFTLDSNNFAEKAILADGTMVQLQVRSEDCTTDWGQGPLTKICGEITLDLNGEKAPNKLGRDIFYLYVTQAGIYPEGSWEDGWYCTSISNAAGCAAKVLQEGAMNY